MNIKYIIIFIYLVFSTGLFGAPDGKSRPEAQETQEASKDSNDIKLSMDVDYAMMDDLIDNTKLSYQFIATITNTSLKAVTIPTRSFDGGPCCWVNGYDLKGVSYFVGKSLVGDKVITPSPARFFPMVLHPGESTEVAVYETSASKKNPLKSFHVDFDIDKEYAEMQNWWHGSLRREIDLTKKKPFARFFSSLSR